MAKGQSRSNKESRKTKDPLKSGKKGAGPKYLRESETLQPSILGSKRPKKK